MRKYTVFLSSRMRGEILQVRGLNPLEAILRAKLATRRPRVKWEAVGLLEGWPKRIF